MDYLVLGDFLISKKRVMKRNKYQADDE